MAADLKESGTLLLESFLQGLLGILECVDFLGSCSLPVCVSGVTLDACRLQVLDVLLNSVELVIGVLQLLALRFNLGQLTLLLLGLCFGFLLAALLLNGVGLHLIVILL